MFQRWRLKLREAEEALAHGRLEEASELLAQENLQDYLPGKRLTTKVARGIADRARQQVLNGDTSAGWRDLDIARGLAGDSEEILQTQRELIEHALQQAEKLIVNRDPLSALSCLERLEQRRVRNQRLLQLKDIARRLESARKLGRRGRFSEAGEQIEHALEMRPDWHVLAAWKAEYVQHGQQFHELSEQLHRMMTRENWSDVARLADEMISLSPENRLARDAKKRAWRAVGARFVDSQPMAETQYWQAGGARAKQASDRAESAAMLREAGQERFQLWVDAVGGFLVCLGDEVSLGQSTPGNPVDIPLQGDLSTLHTTIRRCGEGYLIDPRQSVCLDGKRIAETSLLSDGDEIELAEGIRLRFRLPHALSGTARLDFLSGHRTRPFSDAVLLMAESCVLGPQWHNHIVCRDWAEDVVLYRQDGELVCRAMDSFEIDGCLCDGRGPISLNSHITGDDFSMSLEEIR